MSFYFLYQGLTFFLSFSIFAAVLGMLQFGYNTGVINAPEKNIENFMKDVYKDRYGEDTSEEFTQQLYSVAVSIFAIGGMLGGFSGGWMANRFGRYGLSINLSFFSLFSFINIIKHSLSALIDILCSFSFPSRFFSFPILVLLHIFFNFFLLFIMNVEIINVHV